MSLCIQGSGYLLPQRAPSPTARGVHIELRAALVSRAKQETSGPQLSFTSHPRLLLFSKPYPLPCWSASPRAPSTGHVIMMR